VVDHLLHWFEGRLEAMRGLGVGEEQIAIDPGLGLDLSPGQDLEVMRRLGELCSLGPALHLSLPRRAFIGAPPSGSAEERPPAGEWGTVAAVTLAVRAGADILGIRERSSLQAMRLAGVVVRGTAGAGNVP
jgi:dihydropteroate synthase